MKIMSAYCNSAEIFYEDIYLFSLNGKLLACREKLSRGINNLYDIFGDSDASALRRQINSYLSDGVFFARSLIGPVIVEHSAFLKFGVVLVIIPHATDDFIESDDGRVIVKSRGNSFVHAVMRDVRLGRLHNARTNAEELLLLRDFAIECFRLIGSGLDMNSVSYCDDVCENRIDMDLYALIICCTALLSRRYTDERLSHITAVLESRGICFDIVFKCSDPERYASLYSCLNLLLRSGESVDMPFEISHCDGEIYLRIYPWVRERRDSEVKQDTKVEKCN